MIVPDNPSPGFRAQILAPALIGIVIVAFMQPLVVITTSSMPMHFDDASWRLHFSSLLLGAAPQLAAELVLISAIGLYAGGWKAIRRVALVALVLGVALVPLLLFNALDVIQVRHVVPEDRQAAYDMNAAQTLLMGALMVPALLWAGYRGMRVGRGNSSEAITADDGLVVPVPIAHAKPIVR
jgi:hypothetical protein